MNWIESIGIAATCLVLLSFLQKSESNIRRVNMIGSVLFVAYGILINSLSVWLLNGICILINLYKLIRNRKQIQHSDKSTKDAKVDQILSSADAYQNGYASGYEHGYDDGFHALSKTCQYAEVISEGTSLKPQDKIDAS